MRVLLRAHCSCLLYNGANGCHRREPSDDVDVEELGQSSSHRPETDHGVQRDVLVAVARKLSRLELLQPGVYRSVPGPGASDSSVSKPGAITASANLAAKVRGSLMAMVIFRVFGRIVGVHAFCYILPDKRCGLVSCCGLHCRVAGRAVADRTRGKDFHHSALRYVGNDSGRMATNGVQTQNHRRALRELLRCPAHDRAAG
jgi:hypothetical protein